MNMLTHASYDHPSHLHKAKTLLSMRLNIKTNFCHDSMVECPASCIDIRLAFDAIVDQDNVIHCSLLCMHHPHDRHRSSTSSSSCPNAILWLVLLLLISVLTSDWIISKIQSHPLSWQSVMPEVMIRWMGDKHHGQHDHQPSKPNPSQSVLTSTTSSNDVRIYKSDVSVDLSRLSSGWSLSIIHINDSWNVIASEKHQSGQYHMVWIATRPIHVTHEDPTTSLALIFEQPLVKNWINVASTHPSTGGLLISLDPGDDMDHRSNAASQQKVAWQTMSKIVSPMVPSRAHVMHRLSSNGWMLMQSMHEYPSVDHHVILKPNDIVWINKKMVNESRTIVVHTTHVDVEMWSTDMQSHVPPDTNLNRPVKNFDFVQWMDYFSEMIDQHWIAWQTLAPSRSVYKHDDGSDHVNMNADSIHIAQWLMSLSDLVATKSIMSSMQQYGIDHRALLIDFSIRCGAQHDQMNASPHRHHHVLDLIHQQSSSKPSMLMQDKPMHQNEMQRESSASSSTQREPPSSSSMQIDSIKDPRQANLMDMAAIFSMANRAAETQEHLFAPIYRAPRHTHQSTKSENKDTKPKSNVDKPIKQKEAPIPHRIHAPIHRDIQAAVESKPQRPSLNTCLIASKYIAILKFLQSPQLPSQQQLIYQVPESKQHQPSIRLDVDQSCHHEPDRLWDNLVPKLMARVDQPTWIDAHAASSEWRHAQRPWTVNTQLPMNLTRRLAKQCPL